MSRENLGKVIENISTSESKNAAFLFFDKFESLCKWKEQVCTNAQKDGFAVTSLGNRRYVENLGTISNTEMRWVPNQIVQGTASLIFKKALIEITKVGSTARLLLPMHDAILVEVPTSQIENEKIIIQDILTKKFEEICPSIKAKVTFERFDA